MFVGHFAIALGAKKFVPQVSLGMLFLACQLADLIWPNLVLLGVETVIVEPGITRVTPLNFVHYPYSHSLAAFIAWSALLAVIYQLLTRAGLKVAVGVGIVAFSHWILDVLTHRPDLPIGFGETAHIGLALWNFPILAIVFELILFGVGIWLYSTCTTATDRQGRYGLWALIGFLLLVYASAVFGPPPPTAAAVAWSAQAMWLVVAWGFWIDRHRTASVTSIT